LYNSSNTSNQFELNAQSINVKFFANPFRQLYTTPFQLGIQGEYAFKSKHALQLELGYYLFGYAHEAYAGKKLQFDYRYYIKNATKGPYVSTNIGYLWANGSEYDEPTNFSTQQRKIRLINTGLSFGTMLHLTINLFLDLNIGLNYVYNQPGKSNLNNSFKIGIAYNLKTK